MLLGPVERRVDSACPTGSRTPIFCQLLPVATHIHGLLSGGIPGRCRRNLEREYHHIKGVPGSDEGRLSHRDMMRVPGSHRAEAFSVPPGPTAVIEPGAG